MKRWTWRVGMVLLSLVATYVLGASATWRRRAAALLAVAACFAAGALLALSRLSGLEVLREFTSRSSIVWWAVVAEAIGLAIWLGFFSRESWGRRAVRFALACLAVVGVVAYEAYRFRASGIIQELAGRPAGYVPAPARTDSGRGDWPCWRGASGNNRADDDEGFQWTSRGQVLWKTAVPGVGHSSPCVWGDCVVLTTAREDPPSQTVMTFRRDNGRVLWERTVHRAPMGNKHGKNSFASPTPCTDGRCVYAVFSNSSAVYVTAMEIARGRTAWQTKLGDYSTNNGYAASPTLFGSFVIVSVEGQWRPYVVALLRQSGQIAWRTRLRLEGPSDASPIIMSTEWGDELILPTASAVVSLDAATGSPRWSCPWGQEEVVATAAFNRSRIYVTCAYPRPELMAIELGGSAAPRVLWRKTREAGRVPSPLLAGRDLFLIDDRGVAACLDAETGQTVWRKRLRGEFSASPLLAGGRIYAASEAGEVFVYRADRKFELLMSFDLGAPILASPAVCGGQMFIRTLDSLVCVGAST